MAARKNDATVELPLPDFVDNANNGNSPAYTLHICNATDGGVGKSTLSRVLSEYYQKYQPDTFTLIDADPKLDVAISYAPDLYAKWKQQSQNGANDFFALSAAAPGQDNNDLLSEQIIISNDVAYSYLGDRLLELACLMDVILCQPSNNINGLMSWLDDNNINSSQGRNFKVVSWWLSHGTKGGQDGFVEFVRRYPGISHVFVLNQGINSAVPNWNRFTLEPKVSELIASDKVKFAQLSRFKSDPAIIARVEQGEPFHQVIPTLHEQIQNKVWNWLQSNWDSLAATGLL